MTVLTIISTILLSVFLSSGQTKEVHEDVFHEALHVLLKVNEKLENIEEFINPSHDHGHGHDHDEDHEHGHDGNRESGSDHDHSKERVQVLHALEDLLIHSQHLVEFMGEEVNENHPSKRSVTHENLGKDLLSVLIQIDGNFEKTEALVSKAHYLHHPDEKVTIKPCHAVEEPESDAKHAALHLSLNIDCHAANIEELIFEEYEHHKNEQEVERQPCHPQGHDHSGTDSVHDHEDIPHELLHVFEDLLCHISNIEKVYELNVVSHHD